MVYAYFETGRLIVEEEQKGSQRAVYGKYQIPELSKYLTERIGRGFSVIGISSREVFPTRFTESFFGMFNRYPHLILCILRIRI